MYSKYVFDDKLISPINGHSVRSLKSHPNTIKKFGFSSLEELERLYPGFPHKCKDFMPGFKMIQLKKKKILEYNSNPKKCLQCLEPFSYEKRFKKFCNNSCSTIFYNPMKDEKVLKAIHYNNSILKNQKPKINKIKKYKEVFPHTKIYRNVCQYTGEIFFSSRKYKFKNDIIYKERKAYKSLCKFRFNINKCNIEGSHLIAIYGMYHPVTNPNGVSRDHIISIEYGWKNKIDPKIISHPANCRIILHSENNKKNTMCSMTLSELELKILQYGVPRGPRNH